MWKERAVRRAGFVFALLGLGTLAVVARLVQVQVMEHDHWLEVARSIQEKRVELPARRGTIYDRQGRILAHDVPAYDIALDNFHMTKPELLVKLLEEVLGYSPKEATDLVYREGYFTWIARRLPRWKGEELKRRAEELGVEGLLFFDTWVRAYPEGTYAMEILGVVGVDGAGLEGLEYAFDGELKGKPRVLRLLRGGDGAIYRVEVVDEGEPGRDLHLTLDAEVQRICAEVLEKGTRIFRAKRGLAIVMRPGTGEILAMAQFPRFDPEKPDPALLHPWAVTDPFEPGSTFKALVGAAALDRGVVSPGEVFSAVSPFYVDGVPIRNAGNVSLPEVTFARAITSSLNTVLLQVALRLGKEATWRYLVRFGIGEPTGIGLPGESPGILRPPKEWTRVDLATISFGQGVSVNGAQLARAFCAIAADGLLPKAHLIVGDGGPKRKVISPEAAYTMRELLRLAVEFKYGGTGRWADVEGFGVAGKSGTAQKPDPRGGYSKTKTMGAMAAFFPWHRPEYLVLVVYDEPMTWGGSTAGPTVRWIIEEMYREGIISPYPDIPEVAMPKPIPGPSAGIP